MFSAISKMGMYVRFAICTDLLTLSTTRIIFVFSLLTLIVLLFLRVNKLKFVGFISDENFFPFMWINIFCIKVSGFLVRNFPVIFEMY